MKARLLVPLSAFLVVLMPRVSSSACLPASDCFCRLAPDQCLILVSAEVVEYGEQKAAVRILGNPHHDPGNVVQEDQILEELEYNNPDLDDGDVGLFLIGLTDPCDYGHEERRIFHVVIESDGKYPCENAAEFPGATLEEVVEAVLSSDCRAAAEDLGIISDNCSPIEEGGCCSYSETVYFASNGFVLMLLGLVLLPKKRSGGRA